MNARPYRSVLYIPASKERGLEKPAGLPVDAIIFDLEDAVAPDEKDEARETLKAALAGKAYGRRLRIVRINALDTTWGQADAAAVRAMACDAVLLPKVDGPDQLDALAAITGDLPIWAMMETPRGMLNAAAIAAFATAMAPFAAHAADVDEGVVIGYGAGLVACVVSLAVGFAIGYGTLVKP